MNFCQCTSYLEPPHFAAGVCQSCGLLNEEVASLRFLTMNSGANFNIDAKSQHPDAQRWCEQVHAKMVDYMLRRLTELETP